jgi:hypothetical protein
VLAARAPHRHEQLHVSLRRLAGRAAAMAVLIAGTMLTGITPAPAAGAPGIDTGLAVQPAQQLAADLTQFTLSGTAIVSESQALDSVEASFNGTPVTRTTETLNTSTGAFSATFDVPAAGSAGSVTCGVNTVEATITFFLSDGDREVIAPEDGGSVTIEAFCPSITVTPPVVGSQQLPVGYTVTPSGFPPSEGGFTMTVDGTPTSFTTDDGGNLDFTASPSCGTHTVTLSEDFGEQTASASAQFRVLCPAITLTPASFPLATEPQPVQVTGTQFHPDQPVQVTLDGTPVGTTVTNRDGGFGVPITAAGLDCGAHQVTATEQAAADGGASFLFSASATLQVTNCVLKLTLPPAVVGGEAAHVTGTGFAPGVPVTLTWKLPGASGAALPGTLAVTPDSGGSIDGHFLIIPPGRLGPRQCVATQGKLKLTADTVVTLWPAQPSPGGQLVYRG